MSAGAAVSGCDTGTVSHRAAILVQHRHCCPEGLSGNQTMCTGSSSPQFSHLWSLSTAHVKAMWLESTETSTKNSVRDNSWGVKGKHPKVSLPLC